MGYKDNDACLDKAKPEEPIFVLLGRDPLAGHIVRQWALLAQRTGLHEQDWVDEAFAHAATLDAYVREHYPEKCRQVQSIRFAFREVGGD